MGVHIIADVTDCLPEVLDDEDYVVSILSRAANQCGATILGVQSHKFQPQGVTAVVMLAESHISLHSWPERGECALDIYTCGDMDTHDAFDLIMAELRGSLLQHQTIQRTL
jgi:S-adenosylmethionine decarboxylase proenzyme